MGGESTPGEASEVETLIVETKIERLSGQKLYHGLADIPATPSAWGFHPASLASVMAFLSLVSQSSKSAVPTQA